MMYAAPARYECVKQLKRARRGLDLRLTIEAGELLVLIWCDLMHDAEVVETILKC